MKQLLTCCLLFLSVGIACGQITVEGQVSSESEGGGLIGVTVLLKRTGTGTVTDFAGNFTLTAQAGDTLRFSYTGHRTLDQAVPLSGRMDVLLVEEAELLTEVVVVGYGEQKAESVVGSIVQTDGEELQQKTGGSDLRNALTGLLPGVVTLQGSGIPGGGGFSDEGDDSGTQILIRGLSSWNGNGGPLILVDGVERSMADIDPKQVESMSVLKDASATAVFGVKGANGVILITTKRGAKGKSVLSFETTQSFSSISRIHRALGSPQALRLQNQAVLHEVAINPSSWSFYTPEPIIGLYESQRFPNIFPDVDWYDEMTNDFAHNQKYNLDVTGGTDFVRYYGSLAYLREGDILRTEDLGQGYDPSFQYDRFNFRSNLDFTITPSTTFKVNLAGYYGQQQRPDGNKFEFWSGVYGLPPTAPLQFEDGTYSILEEFDRFDNSVFLINFGGVDREDRVEVNTDFILEQKLDALVPGLKFGARVAFDNLFRNRGRRITDSEPIRKYISPQFINDPRFNVNVTEDQLREIVADYENLVIPAESNTGYEYVEEPFIVFPEQINDAAKNRLSRSLFYQFSLNWAGSFGAHDISALGLVNRQENTLGSEFTSYREDWVSRITYAYDNRYLFEANGAYNGSDKFARDFRFGFFPSVAAGWVVSQEKFFQPLTKVVNKLKFRYSYGLVGDDGGRDVIARELYLGGFDITNINWQFGSPFLVPSPYPWRYEGIIPNPIIQWEEAVKQNFGVEVGLFNSNLQFIADVFREDRTNIFLEASDRNVPIVFGAEPVGVNLGRVRSQGYEMQLKYSKASLKGIGYQISANIGYARDEVLFREDPELTPAYQQLAGYQIGQTRSFLNQPGIVTSWDELYTGVMGRDNVQRLPGDRRLIDYNADGFIDQNDVVPFGYPSRPQYTYGLVLGATWKGFSAQVQFYGAFNVNYNLNYFEFFGNNPLIYGIHETDTWSPERGISEAEATLPHLRFNSNGSGSGERWVDDKSYLKLQNVELGYTLSPAFLDRLGVSATRIFLSGNNLYMWSNILEDRDVPRLTNRDYPLMRRVNTGINITF
ncbi:TonB-dependent receptor [Neolewinella lacunae]|uniref:TonB-dependent receptor n=1 Tax=Neolewinella lacunae TaxID=1517758 RepID=A0A923T871_9BACT|nr:TonB-dependent receptor [Neolewinella lacunae]MBC6994254.1 TonB-dependent receptor [Neolewinella lacunae]MDN3637128.1 TonB-dependent receptor [Neolewinella lacunae]